MAVKLTKFGKWTVIIIIAVILGVLAKKFLPSDDTTTSSVNEEKTSIFSFSNKESYDATIVVDTYTGWAPIVWGNGGLLGTKESLFYKNFGIRLKIVNMDDFDANRAAWKNGDIDLAFVTLDSYPIEMGSAGSMKEARYFVIHNFSAGADAIVVNKSIKTVSDLKGKRIAYSEGTASHTLLLNTLEAAGLTGNDVIQVKTGYGSDVAQAFKAKQVDAAVVFTPDDEACLEAVPGSKILTSTAQANTLITDGFIAKKDWLDKNHDVVLKIIEALLWANSEISYNQDAYENACKVFSETFDVPIEYVISTGKKINFATLQDNINWFGLNSYYRGVTGSALYTKMSSIYTGLDLTKSVLSWNKVMTDSFIDELSINNHLTNDQSEIATKVKVFSTPKKELEKTDKIISNKKVVIEFPTNEHLLSQEAKSIIDNEFVDIALQFNEVRIRVEGNTDNTGSPEFNKELSKKRAQAVVNYLVSEYGMDINRFIVIGNGPKHAMNDGISGPNSSYRTTDFQLIDDNNN